MFNKNHRWSFNEKKELRSEHMTEFPTKISQFKEDLIN